MTDTSSDNIPEKTPRFRSAPYPAITLEKSLERVKEMYEKALHHSVPVNVPAGAWGYGVKSSGLFATVAALKQHGLLMDEGSGDKRRFRLSDDALRIAKDPDPSSEKRTAAIQRAALAPSIYRELWEKFGAPAASGTMDMVVKTHLTLDRGDVGLATYSDKAADDIINGFQMAISSSGLLGAGNIESEDEPTEESAVEYHPFGVSKMQATGQQIVPPPPIAVDAALNDIRVELAGGEVKISARMDIEGLEKLEKKIKALREFMS